MSLYYRNALLGLVFILFSLNSFSQGLGNLRPDPDEMKILLQLRTLEKYIDLNQNQKAHLMSLYESLSSNPELHDGRFITPDMEISYANEINVAIYKTIGRDKFIACKNAVSDEEIDAVTPILGLSSQQVIQIKDVYYAENLVLANKIASLNGSLDIPITEFISKVHVLLTQEQMDMLYDARATKKTKTMAKLLAKTNDYSSNELADYEKRYKDFYKAALKIKNDKTKSKQEKLENISIKKREHLEDKSKGMLERAEGLMQNRGLDYRGTL